MILRDIIEAAQLHRVKSLEAVPPLLTHTFHPYFKVCTCGRGAEPCYTKEICPDALERALQRLILFSPEDVDAGLRNIGQDPTCGACMGIFYTGGAREEHTCTPSNITWTDSTERSGSAREVFQRMVEDPRSDVTFNHGASDPSIAYYWEIDYTHIQHLAEALQVTIPPGKDLP